MHSSISSFIPRGRVRQCIVAIVLGLAIFFMAQPADAQSPAVRYERALAREKAARAMTGTAATTLRTIARSYEAIVHAYPRSGYADNALWQGAGLLQLSYERSGAVGDLQNARRLLNWLKREYPKATLAKQVDGRLNALKAGPKSSVRPAVASTKRPAAPATTTAAPVPTVEKPAAPAPAPAPPVPVAVDETREVASAEPPAPAVPAALDIDPLPVEPMTDAVPAVWSPAPPPRVTELAPLPMPPPSETAVPVRAITHTALPKGDRITIELGREAVYTTSRVGSPDRVEIDLSDAALAANLSDRTTAISGALIKSLSAKRVGRQSARVVIELNGKPRFSTFPLYNPFRLVIDVEGDGPITPAPVAATNPAPASPAPATRASASATRGTKTTTSPAPVPPAPVTPATTIDDPLPASEGERAPPREWGG